ncbi:Chromatin assembly factor 1 subunit A-A [Clonorchis sinensis]|uniref:Chromatin assembly factor 1 subunit A-A n=1 Tax=Clonorchis sinensis TaxID=79923 RepID=A0A8T1M281_CLOSI|nr:Chromatin assembly factor 1 subunit A-A [Clonorchis sinensis]
MDNRSGAKMEKPKTPSSAVKKALSEYQKAHKRAERERLRLMKEHQHELERKKKLEEKERKMLEKQAKKDEEERLKEERRLKRLEELKKKEEEKEAERKRKEEERRKKEEERIQKELERRREEDFKTKREEKQRAVLLGFLVKGEQKKETSTPLSAPCGPFMQFELRKDMRMAPLHRVPKSLLTTKRDNLDKVVQSWSHESSSVPGSSLGLLKFGRSSYIHELKTKQHVPLSCPSTWPTEPPEVMLMGEGLCSTLNSPTLKYHGSRGSGGTVWLRAKLFQFVENYRPAYYGSWRRRSRIVTGRRPFAQDVRQLDYSVDSDDEWEEDEPGESITQSENEEEEEEKDEEEEEDDTFFVPHGYLSDDEGVAAEDVGEEDAAAEEMKNLRRRLSVVEYETAHRRGLQRLIPLVLGPVWLPNPVESSSAGNVLSSNDQLDEDKENIETVGVRVADSTSVDKSSMQLVRSALSIYRIHLWDSAVPIAIQMNMLPTQSTRRTRRELPEEAVPYLIQLVHKSPLGKLKLAFEFRVFWHKHTTGTVPECTQYMDYKRHTSAAAQTCSQRTKTVFGGPAWDDLPLSQTLVLSKLTELAVFEEGRWAVHPNMLRKYRPKLVTLFGLNELSTLGMEPDDAALSAVTFPPWEFLTDVVAISQRSNRPPGSKRRSIDVPVISDEVELVQVPPPADSVPLDTQLLNGHSLTVVVKRLTSVNESTPSPPQRVARKTAKKFKRIENTDLIPLIAQPLRENLVSENVGLVDTTTTKTEELKLSSVPSVGRKRATLDTFFTPPTKRPNVTEQSVATPGEVIHIESD